MSKTRLEAFSDGVMAIIITIMVLELKVPHGDDLEALRGHWPIFLSYVLSFTYIAIYWNNHHHLLYTLKHVTAPVMWANMLLLFWLSLQPVTTGWMGESYFAKWPVFVFGLVLLLAALSYTLLARTIIAAEGKDGVLAKAVGKDLKGKISVGSYLASLPLAFFNPWISCAIFVVVALMWFIPDRRIERYIRG
jgi:uncharacterized membrane protein